MNFQKVKYEMLFFILEMFILLPAIHNLVKVASIKYGVTFNLENIMAKISMFISIEKI